MVFSQKNKKLSNLKLIFFQSTIENFKKFCNSVNLLYANMGKTTYGW